MPPIVIQNLSKVFRGKRGRKVLALSDVSLEVSEGEVFGFLGPNGAGKSTTIKALMGLVKPSNGQALLCDCPVDHVDARRNVGYLPENPAFYDFLSGRNYLRFVAKSFQMPTSAAETSIQKTLERLDLADAADRSLRGYSKGMIQRLGLAQTIIHDPQVYILDEPMSGLDPQGRALVKELIIELGELGKTVFFSTHITSDVEKICDRLAIICKGKLQVVTGVEEILHQGIEGYLLVASGIASEQPLAGQVATRKGTEVEYTVGKDELILLLDAIKKNGGSIERLEPLKRDLENYFLDVVKNSS